MNITREKIDAIMHDCTLCPRDCHVDRIAGNRGFCGQDAEITAARAALHFWEEPCISGKCGSGAVFFTGCSLQCIFCQNYSIAHPASNTPQNARALSAERLVQIFLELQTKGAANINLVTAGHFLPQICLALVEAKRQGLSIPIVYNSSGYEKVSSLRLLEGLVDIYLPDLKYHSQQLAERYSHAPNYFNTAAEAIKEMFRQVGTPVFDSETGLMKKGVIVRHLLLPGQTGESKRILRYLHDTYGNDIYISIMNQYTPLKQTAQIPELNCRVSQAQYDRVLSFADKIGIENGFMQVGNTAMESFIPDFHGEGL